MNRTAFDHLYLNANCIAELGFVRAIVALGEVPADVPATSTAASPGAAAPTAPVFEDESALDGVLGFGALTPEQLAQQLARLQALSLGDDDSAGAPMDDAGESFGEAIGIGALDPEWGAPDVGLYLEQAQASLDALRARMAAAFARADLVALQAALSALPASSSPLSGVLDAGQLESWLVLYDAQEAGLSVLVAQVRALDVAH